MNKKPLDTILQHSQYNDSLFKQSISIVQCTKNITPLAKIPMQLVRQKELAEMKKKQQFIETQLSKTIKLFGQVLGVSKNNYGTVTDYATEIFDEMTDLIQTSCQAYVDKRKGNIKSLVVEKQKEKAQQQSSLSNNIFSSRPHDKNPSIKPALFSRHCHPLTQKQYQPVQCEKVHQSHSITQPLVYVSTKQSLQKMIMQLHSCKQIAVDLQHSSKSYEGFTCLIQISSRCKDYIIDVFPIWEHVYLLKDLIQNEKIVKVMHGAEMDTKWLQRDFDIHIRNLFDTYKASRVLGYPKFSYAYLLHHYCDTVTDKKYQLADWRQRPLGPQMLNYARIDTHYLLQIWEKMLCDLTKQSTSMNLDPEVTIREIYKSSYDVTLQQVELFTYKKKQLYQNIKNDTKAQDFEIIETVFWVIDKVAKQENQAFDQLVSKRVLTDVIGRVKDLIQNKRATVQMLRVKIDRLIGVVRGQKHQKGVLLLGPLKKQLEKYFLQSKKEAESGKKKIKSNNAEIPLIERLNIGCQPDRNSQKVNSKQNFLDQYGQSICELKFIFEKSSSLPIIQQLDYPLKTYENFSLQQRLNNKKNAFSMIQFEPIMSFLSKKFNVQQKVDQIEHQQSKMYGEESNQMEIQEQRDAKAGQLQGNQTQKPQNQGFLQFKRIKPNVIYTLEQQLINEGDTQNNVAAKPKKKRKQLQYEQRIKNKEGNIYDLLEGA